MCWAGRSSANSDAKPLSPPGIRSPPSAPIIKPDIGPSTPAAPPAGSGTVRKKSSPSAAAAPLAPSLGEGQRRSPPTSLLGEKEGRDTLSPSPVTPGEGRGESSLMPPKASGGPRNEKVHKEVRNMNVLGVTLARAGSVGLRNKHLLPLLGRPVIEYTFDHAAVANRLTRVVVSTDCPGVARLAEKRGFEVIDRPACLA